MSDILFCYTDGDSFREDTLDLSLSYQLDGILALAPDMYGLKLWDTWQPDWEKYFLVVLHLNPLVMNPPWWMYPSLIKRKIGDVPLVLSHEFFEKYLSEPFPEMFKKHFNRADAVLVNSERSYDLLREKLDTDIYYIALSQPVRDEMFTVEPLAWEQRNGLLILEHSVFSPIIKKLEIAKKTGLPVHFVSSNSQRTKRNLDQWVEPYNFDEVYTYARLPWDDYLGLIGSCRVALEIDYDGISRFSYECTKMGTPVVGDKQCEFRNFLYPELNSDSPEELVQLIKMVNEHEPKTLNMYANNAIQLFWSKEMVAGRTKNFLRKIGYEKIRKSKRKTNKSNE